MKRVIHILSSNSYSGAENVALTIIKNLTQYDSIYCSPYGSIIEILADNKIKYYRLKKLNYIYLFICIIRLKPDIIHCHDFTASFLCALIPTKAIKIGHIHQNPGWLNNKKSIKFKIFKFTCSKLNKIIFVSDQILQRSGVECKNLDKFSVIYNYINSFDIENDKEVTKKYDVLFIGRLTKEKKPLKFLEIAEKLNKNLTVGLIGNGYLREECLHYIQEKNLMNVELLGYQKNPYSYMKNAKIQISTSLYEGFGLTIVEGIIAGNIVFVPNVGGFTNIFSNIPSIYCESKEDYVSKINYYLENEKAYFELQNELKKQIKPYTDFKAFQKHWAEIYDDLSK